MTKRPKKSTSLSRRLLNGTLTIVVIATTLFLPIALAALLGIALLYYWILALRLPEPTHGDDFTFSATELDTFEALEPREKQMRRALSALWKQGSHLRKRKDGYFSERSKLGKQLNPEIQRLERELGEDRNFIVEYGEFAEQRKRHYIRVKSRRLATTFATLLYATITGLLVNTPLLLIEKLSQAINRVALLPAPTSCPTLWAAMAVAAAATILLFVPLKELADVTIRLKLRLGTRMNANDAIAFSSHYASHSGIGEA